MTTVLHAAGLLWAFAFLFITALVACAAITDRRVQRADVARARQLQPPQQWETTPCDCVDCNRGEATLDQPHTDPNSCRCPQCRAVVDLVRSIVDDRAWDRALTELKGDAA